MTNSQDNKKRLGILELSYYGVGNCIGTGIFISMGLGISYTGRSIPIALLLANILVLFAYSYHTIMAGMFALDGGKYAQFALLQPPLLTGVSALSTMLSGLGFSMFGLSLVEYAGELFPVILPYGKLIATAIIVLFFSMTIKGAKFMARFNLIMVVVLICSLFLFIALGLPKVQPGVFALSEPGYFRGGALGLFLASAAMSFACQGATMPIAMTKDTRDPKRSLPIAILLASGIVAAFYVVLGVVAVGVLPVDQVAGQSLGTVARTIFPYPIYVVFMVGGACFAIATSLFGAIASVQNPMMATIEDGWLPSVLGKKNKDGYPYVLMLCLLGIAILPIYFDFGVGELISCMLIPTMIINTIDNILMVPLVKKYPTAWKQGFFHMPMPLFYLVVILSVLSDLVIVAASFVSVSTSRQILMVVLVVVMFIYSYWRLKTGKVNLKSIEHIAQQAKAAALESEKEA